MTVGLQLGRPGVFRQDLRQAARSGAVRLDVAGFAGVALRGPVDEPTLVLSWADYERRFGGFEPNVSGRDRLLPYAVQTFFAQGGTRAWVVRVAAVDEGPHPTAAQATARFAITGRDGPELVAADEGTWGSGLVIRLDVVVAASFRGQPGAPGEISVPAGVPLPEGSALRIRRPDVPAGELREVRVVSGPRGGRRVVTLDRPLPTTDDGRPAVEQVTVEVITGTLVVEDPQGPGEQVTGLGLHPRHPRFPSRVLADESGTVPAGGRPGESRLVRIAGDWSAPLLPDPPPSSLTFTRTHAGRDRSDAVGDASFFDGDRAVDDPLDERSRHPGVDGLGRVPELGILCVPDLTWRTLPVPDAEDPVPAVPAVPAQVVPTAPRQPRRGGCECCSGAQPVDVVGRQAPAIRPWLEATDPVDLAVIIARQRRTVDVAELRRRFVVLLDVPMLLPSAQLVDWRAAFDSSFAAAFGPWLGVPREAATGGTRGTRGTDGTGSTSGTGAGERTGDPRGAVVMVPPSAFAAGITADRERRLGLSRGPANQLAVGAVRAAEGVGEAEADRLHAQSVNVFAAERDGFRLAAARTLSLDPDLRQLSVRRLMTMLALTVERHGQWLAFEPNTPALRSRLADTLTQLLRDLHRQGAFSGSTEAQSFFVHCDDTVNPPQSQAQGRLVAEVGVAPASPLEYLVLRISSDGDGRLVVDETGGTGASARVRELQEAGRV